MKKLLALLFLLSPCVHAGTVTFASIATAGAYTFIQSNSCNANTFTGTCAYGSAVTAHSLLVVGCVEGITLAHGNDSTVSDNNSNTWHKVLTQCLTEANDNGTRCMNIFYALNANAGSTTVTCHDAASAAGAIQQSIQEYGATAAAAFDVDSSSSPVASIANPNSGNITTTVKNEFVFSYAVPLGGAATGSSGTIRENYVNNYYQATQDATVAVAGTVYASTFVDTAANWVMVQAAFK